MATYFEVINYNGGVVIDDAYPFLEIIDSFPLSQCVLRDSTSGSKYHDYYYTFPHDIGGRVFGISINGNINSELFGVNIAYNSIKFFGNGSRVDGIGIMGIQRQDIINNSTLYVFDIPNRTASEHGIGLEICNADNKVVYDSSKKHFNVISCGSDETKTVGYTGNTVIVTLGMDYYYDVWQSHTHGMQGVEYAKRPAYVVNSNSVTITPQTCTISWIADVSAPSIDQNGNITWGGDGSWADNWEHGFEAYYAYGWLVGNIL